ncbi:hypothetical protein FHS72_002019 [Loktanella ponticola]|uniref:Uncharacterized protein n=1 Tax=Yoonia ponticola TaxID=1524255 RepID=A0A7W9EY45_9RHOB|nr:hypothetical protein [Yoonia ponticola]
MSLHIFSTFHALQTSALNGSSQPNVVPHATTCCGHLTNQTTLTDAQ